MINFIFFVSFNSNFNEGFILNYQKASGNEGFFLELSPIEFYLILANEIKEFSHDKTTNHYNCPIFVSGGIGKLDIYQKINFSKINLHFFTKSYTDDKFEDMMFRLRNPNKDSGNITKQINNSENNKHKINISHPSQVSTSISDMNNQMTKDLIIAEEIELLKENISNLNLKLKSNIEIESKDYFNNIYYAKVSNSNSNNYTFYGELLVRLCKNISDGIIIYFSSQLLMENYIKNWNVQGVFDSILNDKLVFIEENDSSKLAQIVTNFKKSCNVGRGGVLFLTIRNKLSLKKLDILQSIYSKAIIFIGFPIETRLTERFRLHLENLLKNFEIERKDYLNYDTFRYFSTKIAEKIKDCEDRKIMLLLDEKLSSENFIEFLPIWLKKIIHDDFDKENINTEDRIKKAKRHLDFIYDIEKL